MNLLPALERHGCAVLVLSVTDPEELHCFVVYTYSPHSCAFLGFLVENTPQEIGPWDFLLHVGMMEARGLPLLVRRVETVLQAIYAEEYMTQRKQWTPVDHPTTPDFEETAAIAVIHPALQRYWERAE